MNRSLPFGIHNIGYHYTIKINLKLTVKAANELYGKFPDHISVLSNEKGAYTKQVHLHRIEGIIHHSQLRNFKFHYELAKKFTKLHIVETEIGEILESSVPLKLPEFKPEPITDGPPF